MLRMGDRGVGEGPIDEAFDARMKRAVAVLQALLDYYRVKKVPPIASMERIEIEDAALAVAVGDFCLTDVALRLDALRYDLDPAGEPLTDEDGLPAERSRRRLADRPDLNSHPLTLAFRGERGLHGTHRGLRQDSRLRSVLSHVRTADERDHPMLARRAGGHPRLSAVSRGPGPIRVSRRPDRPTRLREIRTASGHGPLHDRAQRRGSRGCPQGAATRQGPSHGAELRRRAGDCDRVEVPAEAEEPGHHGSPRERPADRPRDAASRESPPAEDPGDPRAIPGEGGPQEPRVPRRRRRVLPEARVSPPRLAP